jgi:hypothetical protein
MNDRVTRYSIFDTANNSQMNSLATLVAVLLFVASSAFKSSVFQSVRAGRRSLSMASFYDIVEKDATGAEVSFEKFRGILAGNMPEMFICVS